MSLGRRLGRLARGFVSNINDERLKETIRTGRERGETLRDAFGAAWQGAAEEWRAASEERASEEAPRGPDAFTRRARWSEVWSEARQRAASQPYAPRQYPPEVLSAYHRLGLGAGSSLEEANRRRRELIKRYHPDRFADPQQRERAERLTAEINAAHDAIERHLTRGK